MDDFILRWWDKIIAGLVAFAGAYKWIVTRSDAESLAALKRLDEKEQRLNSYSDRMLEDARSIANEFRAEKNSLMEKIAEYLGEIAVLRQEVAACRAECERERVIHQNERSEHEAEIMGYRRRIRALEDSIGISNEGDSNA